MVDPIGGRPIEFTRSGTRATEARLPSQPSVQLTAQSSRAGEAHQSLPKLVSLAAELAATPVPIDFARIAQIRQAIADGSYQVDPDKIAEAILRFDGKTVNDD